MTFNETFKEVVFFQPEGLYISRRIYNREKAAELMIEAYAEQSTEKIEIKPEELVKAWVRFGPTGMMEDELGKMAWMICSEGINKSQPVWGFLQ